MKALVLLQHYLSNFKTPSTGAANSLMVMGSGRNSNLFKLIMVVFVTCKNEEGIFKIIDTRVVITSPIISL